MGRLLGLLLYPDLYLPVCCGYVYHPGGSSQGRATVAVAIGRKIYNTHRQLYWTTVKENLSTSVKFESNLIESAPVKETIFTARLESGRTTNLDNLFLLM